WRSVRHFIDASDPTRLVRPDANLFAVATTEVALWAGTSEGLMKSTDGGQTWRIFRTDVPLHPDEVTADIPDVDTYAYPNPFSPQNDRIVRVRFESNGGSDELRIFDYQMNLVRRVTESGPAGVREIVWNGTDEGGLRVSNGVYFYSVHAGGDTVWGKIHVLE
ncbi:MAG: FlgD immunoglobulin-like domain containing protein, partial [Rhodothermales bacterium]